MTPLALYRQMLANGMDEETAYTMAEQFEASEAAKAEERYQALLSRLSVDVKAQARRDKDKERKREAAALRKSAESAESAETLSEGSKEKVSPTPPSKTQPPNLTQEPPISPTKSARKTRLGPPKGAFSRFWAEYPLKVGKLAAERAYAKAWDRCESDDPEAEMLDGLKRCRSAWDPEFIPHPTTFLNQGRWMDVPEPDLPDATGPPKLNVADYDAERARVRAMIEAEEAA